MRRKLRFSALLLFLLLSVACEISGQWLEGYRCRKEITVKGNHGAEDLIDFPLLVKISSPELKSASLGGTLFKEGSDELRFTEADCVTLLDHEVELYLPAEGEVYAWVRIPSLPGGDALTTIYLYFSNPDATSSPPSSNVWKSTFKGVWHMSEVQNDATQFENHGTLQGPTITEGKIGLSRSFDGIDDYIDIPADESLNLMDSLSITAWVKLSGEPSPQALLSKKPGYALKIKEERVILHAGKVDMGREVFGLYDNNWHYICATYDKFTKVINVCGESMGEQLNNAQNAYDPTKGITLGSRDSLDRFFNGELDEVWLLSEPLSTRWIETTYANQNNPAGFAVVSSSEIGNDFPCAAALIDVEDTCSVKIFSNTGSGDSEVNMPECIGYNGSDTWFKLEIPTSGKVRIQLDNTPTPSIVDPQYWVEHPGLAVYSGSCGNLTHDTCWIDESTVMQMPDLSLSGYIPGDTLFVRVWGYMGEMGFFKICALANDSVPPIPIVSATTGDWDVDSTWIGRTVPQSSDDVIITGGHIVSMTDNNQNMKDLTIHTGGELNDNGFEPVVSGNLTVDGAITTSGTGKWRLPGPNITFDGRGSISTNLFEIEGNVTFLPSTDITINMSDHLRFSGNIDIPDSAIITINTMRMIIAGGVATNNGTVNTASIEGDDVGEGTWINNGTLNFSGVEITINTFFATDSGNIVNYNGSALQEIKDATYANLSVNNSGPGIANNADITVFDTLLMIQGNIDLGEKILTLGGTKEVTKGGGLANTGTLLHTSGTILGKFERWVNESEAEILFPVGTADFENFASVSFRNLTEGSLISEFVSADPMSTGLPLSDLGYTVSNQFTEGFWNLTAVNGLSSSSYSITLDANGFSSYAVDAVTRIITRENGGDWYFDGIHSPAVNPSVFRNHLTQGISATGTQFGIGTGAGCIPIVIERIITDINCNGGIDGAIDITVSGGLPEYSYLWSQHSTSEDLTDIGAGNYTVTVTDAEGCSQDSTFNVSEPDILSAILNHSNESCRGSDGSIIISSPSGGKGTYEFSNDGGTGWQGFGSFTSLSAGSYSIRMRDSATATCVVILNESLVLELSTDTIAPVINCPDNMTEVLGSSCEFVLPDYTDPAFITDDCDPAPLVTQTPPAGTILTCSGSIQEIVVATIDLSGNESECLFNLTLIDNTPPTLISLRDTAVSVEEGHYKVQLTIPAPKFADNCGIGSIVNNFNGGPDATGIYQYGTTIVTYTVEDINGNGAQFNQQVIVELENAPDHGLVIPEAFSPNEDGFNDRFEILGLEQYPDNVLQVYNVFGIEVYTMTNYDNSWDGTSSANMNAGKKLPTGTYYYVMYLENGATIIRGFVYIRRE
ncbi:MAG: DUF2341 domain-containing protein [Bacteroidetes bacterium]|nr:DUF2341 domain-containing protein [Bacteroidota bacterium]